MKDNGNFPFLANQTDNSQAYDITANTPIGLETRLG